MRPSSANPDPAGQAAEWILSVGGMHCASCVGRVEKALLAVPGVSSATVNLASGRAFARLSGNGHADELAQAVRRAGFEAEPLVDTPEQSTRESQAQEAEAQSLRNAFLLAAALTLPIFALEMGSHLIPGMAD